MKKILLVIILIIIVVLSLKFIPTIPNIFEGIKYSNVILKPDSSYIWNKELANYKPELLYSASNDYSVNQKIKGTNYYIEFDKNFVSILYKNEQSLESEKLFTFNRSTNQNRPTIYKKEDYIIVVADSLEYSTGTMWNFVAYNEKSKEKYEFEININAKNVSLNEFDKNPYLYLDITDDILYVPINEYFKDKIEIITYNLKTKEQKNFIKKQNSSCNNLYFVIKDDTFYWQEKFEKADLGFLPSPKIFEPVCKSYKYVIKNKEESGPTDYEQSQPTNDFKDYVDVSKNDLISKKITPNKASIVNISEKGIGDSDAGTVYTISFDFQIKYYEAGNYSLEAVAISPNGAEHKILIDYYVPTANVYWANLILDLSILGKENAQNGSYTLKNILLYKEGASGYSRELLVDQYKGNGDGKYVSEYYIVDFGPLEAWNKLLEGLEN